MSREESTDEVAQYDYGFSEKLAGLLFLLIAAIGVSGLVYSHFFLGGVSI